MSLPREILDQLLSGYLDDALSADERTRVERLLETDEEFARELVELQEIRRALRDVSQADSGFRLADGFTDRVLDAAVACAKSEGLGEDHPLVRLAEQPSTQRRSDRSASPLRTAAVLVALAASVAFAVFALQPDGNEGLGGVDVAQVDPPQTIPGEPAQVVSPDSAPVGKSEPNVQQVAVAPQAVGAATEPEGSEIQNHSNELGPDAIGDPVGQGPPVGRGPVEKIAAAESPEMTPRSPPASESSMVSSNDPKTVSSVGEIMVLNVRLTQAGRESQAVRAAMVAAEISPATEKQISDEVVGLANDAAGDEEGDATVLYLQAPSKNIDRFFLSLVADEAGIESVGMTLVLDAPIVGVVKSLKVDPTTVRHAGSGSWQLSSESGASISAIAHDLDQRQYIPMDRTFTLPAQPKGPVVMSQILVLVR